MSLGKKSSKNNDDEPIRTISDTSGNRAIGFGLGDTNASSEMAVKPDEDMTKWLKEAAWKQPKWLKRTTSEKPKNLGFRGYYLNSLRARYLRLESDFRTGYSNFYHTPYMDLVTSRRIISFLQTSKEALEDDDCDVTDVITMLDMVDQNMVWIYPPHYAYAQAYGLAADLKGQTNEGNRAWGCYLEDEIVRLGPDNLGGIRAALDKTKEAINEAKQAAIISNGLQIERLKTARNWSWIVLGASLVFLPMVINFDNSLWEKTLLGKFLPEMRPWLVSIAVGIFGAGGAFFSSLRSVQTTRTVLSDFQENLKSSQLKLNIGALAALILFVFMSWQIIPGIDVKNAGTFIFLAFIAGFSEKFFLNLLNIDEQSDIAPRPAPAELKETAQILPPAPEFIAPPTADVVEKTIDEEEVQKEVKEKVEISQERM